MLSRDHHLNQVLEPDCTKVQNGPVLGLVIQLLRFFYVSKLTDFSLFHWHSSFNFDKCEVYKIRGKLDQIFFEQDLSDTLLNLVIRPRSMSVVREEIEKTIGWKEPPGKHMCAEALFDILQMLMARFQCHPVAFGTWSAYTGQASF